MAQALELLDRAMGLGRQELARLEAGEIEAAETLARERGELIMTALGLLEGQGTSPQVVELLVGHRDLQEQLSAEVLRLREETGAVARRAGQELRRLGGYRQGSRPVQGGSRFVSRQS